MYEVHGFFRTPDGVTYAVSSVDIAEQLAGDVIGQILSEAKGLPLDGYETAVFQTDADTEVDWFADVQVQHHESEDEARAYYGQVTSAIEQGTFTFAPTHNAAGDELVVA